jgi:hypothetical protein
VAALGLAGAVAALPLIEIEDRATGAFQVRSAARAELRAPAAAFVKEVRFDEGKRAEAGAVVFRLEVPDLDSRLTQKRAEVRET